MFYGFGVDVELYGTRALWFVWKMRSHRNKCIYRIGVLLLYVPKKYVMHVSSRPEHMGHL